MTSTSSLKVDTSGVADFQGFGSAISTALGAAGWVKDYSYSSDQSTPGAGFSWSNINNVPSAAGTTFEVWRMSDSLQTSLPFFVRIDYWNNSGTYLRFTLGNANSSGVISGGVDGEKLRPQDAFVSLDHNVSDPSSQGRYYTCVFSGSTSSFRMGLFLDSFGGDDAACYYAFERSKSNNGTETASYVTFLAHSVGQGKEQMSIGNMVRPDSSMSTWLGLSFTSGISGISHAETVGAFPILSQFDGIELPLQNTFLCKYSDISNGLTNVTATAYGTTATYKKIVNGTTQGDLGSLASSFGFSETTFAILMLWS
jgi:hypothetical protein